MKEFNLEDAKRGVPVCTRDGRKARIICYDRKAPKIFQHETIVALVQCQDNSEDPWCYYPNGHFVQEYENPEDLMMDIPELTQHEKEYLSAVIKPFKEKVQFICKRSNYLSGFPSYIFISLILNSSHDETVSLPHFVTNTMYKGMELDKRYTLEELGL